MASSSESLKVHLGCGAVYLIGWDNIDVADDKFEFAKARPDLVRQNQTTLDRYYLGEYYNNYYQRYLLKKQGSKDIPTPQGTPSKDIGRRSVVIDHIGWANKMPYACGSVDILMCVQVLEHFSPPEAIENLKYWRDLLTPNGRLIVDIPDFLITSDLISKAETEDERSWGEKLIYGTRNDQFAFHKVGYWPKKLAAILERAGYSNISDGPDLKHNYPAFSLSASK